MDDMWPIINEFLTESYENLDQLDQDLVDLEANPGEQNLLASIFRTIHTIKGTCGFLGFTKLESVAHVGENLLSKLRDGELDINPPIASALLSMVDAIRQILTCIEKDQNEGTVDYSELVKTLTRLQTEPQEETTDETPVDTDIVSIQDLPTEAVESQDPETETLFNQLGGAVALDLAVDLFFDKVAIDSRIQSYFPQTDLLTRQRLTRTFLTFAFEGPLDDPDFNPDEGKGILFSDTMSDAEKDAVIENLEITFRELKMAEDHIQEARGILQAFRGESHPTEKGETSTNQNPEENQVTTPEQEPQSKVEAPMDSSPTTSSPDASTGNPEESKEDSKPVGTSGRSQESIRVDVELLDTLMNLVGELVLARNQIVQYNSSEKDGSFQATTQHLNQLTTELQEGVMKTRMQPIGNIWSKFPRVVRDLSHSIGKKVRLEMEGKETELDKTLIEAIKDPLTHIVRNSVDHGIESPEVRKERGKDPEGFLKLRAYHEGGQVNIEIADDGGGIDPEKIRAKALAKNIITQQQAARMGDREITNLIFSPGFSTAEKISNISGRGVGMDVVKTNIEKIGGTVDIQSQVGQGTTLKVKIPLTLAIIPALVVMTGGLRYAIPQVSLVELVRLEADQSKTQIEQIQGAPVYRLRGNLLPLVFLNQELKVEQKLEEEGVFNIVVLHADNRQFGLVVDGIRDSEEIVVKPLGKQLKGISAYAGSTIMGDGKVALILDVMGLAQKARVVSETGQGQSGNNLSDKSASTNLDVQTLLIFSLGGEGRMAVPLSMVARLEEFKRDVVERSGDQEVVQYRNEIMPLIYLSDVFGGLRAEDELMQVIVYSDQGRSVGVVVNEIIDIVEEAVSVKQGSASRGILGSAVIQGKVTDLLDVEGVIREADPSFYDQAMTAR